MNMRPRYTAFLLALAMIFAIGATESRAQAYEADYGVDEGYDAGWEFNVNSGVLVIDDPIVSMALAQANVDVPMETLDESEPALIVGTRLFRQTETGLGVGVQGSWSPTTTDYANLFLYSAEGGYEIPAGPVNLFASVGLGGATTLYDENIEFDDLERDSDFEEGDETVNIESPEDVTNWYVPIAVGMEFELTNDLALMAKARDNLIYLDNTNEVTGETFNDHVNELQFTAGLTLLF